jgi:Holliday junction resolvase-like predicted endonuclease
VRYRYESKIIWFDGDENVIDEIDLTNICGFDLNSLVSNATTLRTLNSWKLVGENQKKIFDELDIKIIEKAHWLLENYVDDNGVPVDLIPLKRNLDQLNKVLLYNILYNKVFIPREFQTAIWCNSDLSDLKRQLDKIAQSLVGTRKEKFIYICGGKRIRKGMNKIHIDEATLEELVCANLEQIEHGLTLVQRQYPVEGGRIDILAKDRTDTTVIIELKVSHDDPSLIFQCVYYPKQFAEKTRMITIAPYYSQRISNTLKDLDYVEPYTYIFDNDRLRISKIA